MAKPSARVYQIKVTLNEVRRPIGRRVLVPGTTTLLKLHDILQIVMGWVEKIQLPQPSERYPLCLAGKRACPPGDVGGVWGC